MFILVGVLYVVAGILYMRSAMRDGIDNRLHLFAICLCSLFWPVAVIYEYW